MRCAKLSKIGETVRGNKGRYKIVKALDKQGAMGLVFVAETTSKPKTEVIIKFARVDVKISEKRLVREIKLLQLFQETKPKNVVAYIDESDESEEELFLVMEYLKGQDLGARAIDRLKPKIDAGTVIRFSKDIAEALSDLHKLHAIHRDLKPENMVVVRRNDEEHCILVDFGIGKLTTEDTTGDGIVTDAWSCKHNFANPLRVGEDCDVYALGRIMFYIATGQHPSRCEYPLGDDKFGNMWAKAVKFGANAELSNLIDDMISYSGYEMSSDGIKRQIEPAHKFETAEQVLQRLGEPWAQALAEPSAYKQQKVQPRKYTTPPRQQLLQGPHIIIGGERKEIVGNRCEIGRAHTCPDLDRDCSRGVLHAGMDGGFDYPRNPDIEIPLIGSPGKSVAFMHHIRIWKDKGEWYVRDLDTTNYSAILKNNNWEPLNDIVTRKGKTMMLDQNFTKLAIGYRFGGRTEIEFSFYKQ